MVWGAEMPEGVEDDVGLSRGREVKRASLGLTERAYERAYKKAICGMFGAERLCLRAVDFSGRWRVC